MLKEYFKKVQSASLRNGYILINTVSRSKTFLGNYDEYKRLSAKIHVDGFWEKYRAEKAKDSVEFNTMLKPLVRSYFSTKGKMERDALNYPIQGELCPA